MGKRKFINECLEKLEDIDSFQEKGGALSTGEFTLKDLTSNLLPILKDLIEENISLKERVEELDSTREKEE